MTKNLSSSNQESSSQLPRISGVLYNCALNCALPSIFETINKIEQRDLNNESIPYIESYKMFKQCFENWYGIKQSLSWSQFNTFINQFNFTENELIFAPVIRQFIANQATDDENVSLLRDIVNDPLRLMPDELKEYYAQNPGEMEHATPGRYFAMQNHEANRYFYKPFGLSMRVHNWNNDNYVAETNNDREDFKKIDVYLKHAHYELQPHESLPQYETLYHHKLSETIEMISSDQSCFTTNKALADLIPFVRSTVADLDKSLSYIDYFNLARKNRLHNDTPEGKLTFTVILLLLMEIEPEFKKDAKAQLTELEKNGTNQLVLVNETLKQINGIVTSCASGGTNLTSALIVADTLPKAQVTSTIKRDDLKNILDNYQTSYVIYNFFLMFVTCGFVKHSSGTILALQELLKEEKDYFSQDDIAEKINQESNKDSKKEDRYNFFNQGQQPDDQARGTDKVLSEIKKQIDLNNSSYSY
jgi:hypothetical protein